MPMHVAWSPWTSKILLDREPRPTEHCRGMEITHWHPRSCDWHGLDHSWKPPLCTVPYQWCLVMDKGRVNPQGFDEGRGKGNWFRTLMKPIPLTWVLMGSSHDHVIMLRCLLTMINKAHLLHCMSVTLLPPYPGGFPSDSFCFYLKIIVLMCRKNIWIDNSLMCDGYGAIWSFISNVVDREKSYLSMFLFIYFCFSLKIIVFLCRINAQVDNSLALHGCSTTLRIYRQKGCWEQWTISLLVSVCFFSFLSQSLCI